MSVPSSWSYSHAQGRMSCGSGHWPSTRTSNGENENFSRKIPKKGRMGGKLSLGLSIFDTEVKNTEFLPRWSEKGACGAFGRMKLILGEPGAEFHMASYHVVHINRYRLVPWHRAEMESQPVNNSS